MASVDLSLSNVKILVEASTDISADPFKTLGIIEVNVAHVRPVNIAACIFNTVVVKDALGNFATSFIGDLEPFTFSLVESISPQVCELRAVKFTKGKFVIG